MLLSFRVSLPGTEMILVNFLDYELDWVGKGIRFAAAGHSSHLKDTSRAHMNFLPVASTL